ncbi:hypothetical protein Dalu01_01295 [Deinococcus aluminii]|uniref:Uncharacterized protein n=1 Tax=Deinococcus aluminii TaxID=1656885 RepID=A0ABP9XC20_9DEIO
MRPTFFFYKRQATRHKPKKEALAGASLFVAFAQATLTPWDFSRRRAVWVGWAPTESQ